MSLHPWSLLSLAAMLVLTSSRIVHVDCEVRLVDSPATVPNAGRVEVRYPNTSEWLDVCANDWGFTDGQIVCKELGYPGTVLVKTGSEYGAGGSENTTGGFICTGDEPSLLNCTSNDPNKGPCGDTHTAGVVCAAPGYEGCKMEIDPNSDTILIGSTIRDNTVEKCIKYAIPHRDDALILYAAMEGNVCWVLGLQNLQIIADLPGVNDSSMCDTPCLGNPDQRCGGKNLYSVYNVQDGFCTDQELPNGELAVQPTPEFFYFGTVVNFSCNPGFDLQGAPSVQCVMGGSEPAQVTWSNSTPECTAGPPTTGDTTTAKLGTAPPSEDGVDTALILSIVNLALLLIIAIVIGLYCCFIRKRDGSPRADKLPRYTKTDSLEMINDRGDRQSTAIEPRPAEPAVTLKDLPQYTTVDKPLKRISREPLPRPNSGFVMDEGPKRPRSKHSEPAKNRVSKSRSQVDNNEEIMGTIIVSPLANQERDRRSREQKQPMSENQGEGWHENETYDSVETNPGYPNDLIQ